MFAADFRKVARDVLRGKWGVAVLAGFLASLLGALQDSGPELNFNFDGLNSSVQLEFAGQTVFSTGVGLVTGLLPLIVTAIVAAAALYYLLGSAIAVGYAKFNLRLLAGQSPDSGVLFSCFGQWSTAVCTRLLKSLKVFLWSLLFIIPGIVASYSYAMTDYILAEFPELSAGDAVRHSKEMMEGNRARLFCLQLSFIGWDILCLLTLGIGNLWLTPYAQAATAAFYREVSAQYYIRVTDTPVQ